MGLGLEIGLWRLWRLLTGSGLFRGWMACMVFGLEKLFEVGWVRLGEKFLDFWFRKM